MQYIDWQHSKLKQLVLKVITLQSNIIGCRIYPKNKTEIQVKAVC